MKSFVLILCFGIAWISTLCAESPRDRAMRILPEVESVRMLLAIPGFHVPASLQAHSRVQALKDPDLHIEIRLTDVESRLKFAEILEGCRERFDPQKSYDLSGQQVSAIIQFVSESNSIEEIWIGFGGDQWAGFAAGKFDTPTEMELMEILSYFPYSHYQPYINSYQAHRQNAN